MQMRRRAWLTAWAIGIGLAAPAAAAAAPAEEPTPLAGIPNSPVHAVAVDGTTAYVGGEFRHVSRYTGGFAALDPVSSELAPGWPAVDGRVYALAPDGAGGWYLGGDFSAVGGVARRHLAHVRPDRTVDPAWAPSTDGTVYSIAAFGTAVFAGGIFSTVNGGTARTSLAAFDAATGAVTDFTGGLSDGAEVWTMAVQAGAVVAGDTRLYVGGRFSVPQKNLVSYDLATGAPDPAFDPVVTGSSVRTLLVRDLNPHPIFTDITVYVGGDFSQIDGQPRNNLAALKPDGTLLAWSPTLPPGGFGGDFVYALAARGSTVYVGGGFGLAAYDRATGARRTEWTARVDYQAQALTVVGSTVYVGGMFFRVNGDAWRTNLAAFDAVTGAETSWDPEASGSGGVAALATDGTTVFAAGDFVTAGGVERGHIAAFDVLSGRLLPFHPDVSDQVEALAVSGGKVYAGGSFTTVNGTTPRNRLAAFDAATGIATPFDPNVDSVVLALAVSGSRVFAGGTFSTVGGTQPRNRLAVFDAETGAAGAFAPDVSSTVYALAAAGPVVYAAGNFTDVGTPRGYAAGFQDVAGTQGAPLPFDPRLDSGARSLALDGSTVYVGGFFTKAAGGTVDRVRLGAFDAATGAPTPFAPVLDNPPYALALADGLLVAGGSFRNVNGRLRTGLGAVDPATGALDAWAPQADDEVLALASSADAGLLVGGRFHRMESAPGTPYLAAFALRPATPAAPVATAGDGRATVTPGALPSGGAPIQSITATASPGGRSVSGPPGPLVVDGLANGIGYTFTVTATNRVGTSSASAPSGAVTPAGGGRDAIAPLIGGLRLSNRRFAVGARSTPRIAARKTKRGTTFRFTLSEPAATRITIARARPGRRQGSRCVKPRKRLKRACMRFRTAAALTRAGAAGANRIDYSGRIGKRKLKRGRYRATLVATDAAGNASRPARVTFRVVAR